MAIRKKIRVNEPFDFGYNYGLDAVNAIGDSLEEQGKNRDHKAIQDAIGGLLCVALQLAFDYAPNKVTARKFINACIQISEEEVDERESAA